MKKTEYSFSHITSYSLKMLYYIINYIYKLYYKSNKNFLLNKQSSQDVCAVTCRTLFCLLFNAVIKRNAKFSRRQPLLQLLPHHSKVSHMAMLSIYETDNVGVRVQAQKGGLTAYSALV